MIYMYEAKKGEVETEGGKNGTRLTAEAEVQFTDKGLERF